MLISYPFLTPTATGPADDCAPVPNDLSHLGELTGTGTFPLTQGIEWHGGSHWRGPAPEGQVQPVRAIADGEVVFARASDGKPTNPDALAQHPLWYSTGWTSNGVVILKHTTEIGENVSVTFYSIYQHMDTLTKVGPAGHERELTHGDKVYRKDVIGTAGFIYGQPHHIHIEIVADRANTALLMGRDHDELMTTQGRTSCVWGDTHIVVPAGVPIYEVDPRATTVAFRLPTLHMAAASVEALFHTPIARLRALTPSIAGLDNASDSDGVWFSKRNGDYQHALHPGSEPTNEQRTIQVPLLYGAAVDTAPSSPQRTQLPERHFAKEVGRTPKDILVTLSEASGKVTVNTRLEPEATPVSVDERGAYDLYERSLKAYPGCPSAGYEMLRFGRILGPDPAAASDLHMGRLPHFRQIAFTNAQGQRVEGFIDLNTQGASVFCDADFPHWDGWTFIDDDVNIDSRARSKALLDLIDPPPATPAEPLATPPTPEQARQQQQARFVRMQTALANTDTQKKLRKCVVTMATEWSTANFDKQWSWLKGTSGDTRSMGPGTCVSDEVYDRFKRHHAALAFWEEAKAAGLDLDPVHVHFHPGEFISAFRKCGWLSKDEFKRVYPRASQQNVDKYLPHINKIRSKYCLLDELIGSHFFGQAAVESNQLLWMSELFNGDPMTYFRHYETAKNYVGWLGNVQWNDGGKFRGRGFKQMTGRANYHRYWTYRGWLDPKSVKDNWWTNLGWWGLSGSYHQSQDANKPAIQNQADAAQLIAEMKPPIIEDPDVVQTEPFNAIDTAGWFWARNGLHAIAARNDTVSLTNRIRGDRATIPSDFPADAHYPERVESATRIRKILGDSI